MSRRPNRRFWFSAAAAAAVTVIGLVGVNPVDAQTAGSEAGESDTDEVVQAHVDALRDEAVEQIRAVLEAQPTGSGRTVSDALQRVVADLNTFDLETGEEKTSLTWNFHFLGMRVDPLGVRVDFVNDPEVFPALESQLGDDLAEVQRRVGVGDDVEVSGTLHFNWERSEKETKRPVGLRMAHRNAAQLVKASLGRANVGMEKLESELSVARGPLQEERVRSAFESLWTDIAFVEANVSELLVSAGYRWRSEEVGPSSWSVNGRFSWGIRNPDALNKRIQVLTQQGKGVGDRVVDYWNVVENTPIIQQRLTIDFEYRNDERYEFDEFIDAPLVFEPRSYLKATAAYSLRFESDEEKKLYLPRYEVRASFEWPEDVDLTIDQGDRWVVSAIVIKPVPLFGSFVDLTVGVVWASRPEYVMEEHPDRMLGANVGLKLRLGRNTYAENGDD